MNDTKPSPFKTALITGGYRGIGFEVSRRLAAKGYHIYLTSRRPEVGLSATQKLKDQGLPVHFLLLDVSDDDSVQKAAHHFSESSHVLDVLINNAAILPDQESDSIFTAPMESYLRAFQTNALGALRVTRAFLPFLKKSPHARVINVSSGAGSLSENTGWAPAYSTSKTALNAITVHLSKALKSISVNSVCPGWVRTEMGGLDAPRSVKEGADSLVWLATDASPSLTGKFIRDRKPISF